MNVLGVSGCERDAAAALSVDGVIVAAVAEEGFARLRHVGYRYTGGYPHAAIQACLLRAGLSGSEIDRVVVVDDASAAIGAFQAVAAGNHDQDVRSCAREVISPALADARQLGTVSRDEQLPVLVLSPESSCQAVCFWRGGAELVPSADGERLAPLMRAVSRISRACGFDAAAYDHLEQFASQWRDDDRRVFDRALAWDAIRGVVVDDVQFEQALTHLVGGAAEGAAEHNVHRERERQAVAWSFCSRVNALVVQAVAQLLTDGARSSRVGLAGSLFAGRGLLTALTVAFGDAVVVAPVPEGVGRAIGAALESPSPIPLLSLALGSDYSEQDIKQTLENCRLEYLYEPDWIRLLARVSRMLSRGSVVGWFQGPASFGPCSVGARSILCDPSNRYARENVNRFLRQVDINESLPVAMTGEVAAECLEHAPVSPFHLIDARVKLEWVDRLRAGIGRPRTLPLTVTTEDQSPVLYQLLRHHFERTGVPGLVSVPLCGPSEPAACTPRDAVRSVFSSATDALVVGRFLLMKDYWLLRSTADA